VTLIKNRGKMTIQKLKELKTLLKNKIDPADKTAIITHKNPDGDGIGAALALQKYLSHLKIKTDLVLENKLPTNYEYLNAGSRITLYDSDLKYNNLILVDCHESGRLGICGSYLSSARLIITIDHHQIGKFIPESLNFIDPDEVCAGMIIYKMIADDLKDLPRSSIIDIANCVYMAILNDTDNFLNLNTNAEVFRVCSELASYGINAGKITEQFFYHHTVAELKYLGKLLSSIEIEHQGQILILCSTQELLKYYQLDLIANSKLTRWVKGTQGIKVIAFFQEIDKNRTRISLRSNSVNVKEIASTFGGGGHKRASGCEINTDLKQAKSVMVNKIIKHL